MIHGNDPTASHCTNIGPIHRKGIYAALKKWFDIPVPEKESKERRPAERTAVLDAGGGAGAEAAAAA